MRLVSQKGMNRIYDLPYEKCLVYIYNDNQTIKVQPLGEVDSEYIFAKYSTEAKAIKVMEMLRSQYQRIWNIENGFIDPGKINNHIFTFPKDEEVEV